MRRFFYKALLRRLSLFVRPGDRVVEINPQTPNFRDAFEHYRGFLTTGEPTGPVRDAQRLEDAEAVRTFDPAYILLHGNLHFERDIQAFLEEIHGLCSPSTRVLVLYYSSLWRPLLTLATKLGLRQRTPEKNWIAPGDAANLLNLSDFEQVRREKALLMPFYFPVVSGVMNRFFAKLPPFSWFTILNIALARPKMAPLAESEPKPSVSVIVPARNEAGNIADAIRKLPPMGPDDEIIFIEGNSTDNTWDTIEEVQRTTTDPRTIRTGRQDGKGKGDAVRKGFAMAEKDILMILDADLTTPPEDMPKFYDALIRDRGEFINGSRLVYPMEKKAMRFLNLLGNKFFAAAFSFVLGQTFKDTLCGTKVLTRENYERLAANRDYFGDFDPFGDFDLIFGAARMGLKIVEVPVRYGERTYGDTNIQRWKHGALLFRMLFFAARKLKFT